MNTVSGVVIEKGVRLLRGGLWLGVIAHVLLGVRFLVSQVSAQPSPTPPFYSALIAISLITLSAVGVTAAYAPRGNRTIIRWLAAGHFSVGLVALAVDHAPTEFPLLTPIELLVAGTIFVGLRLARL